MIAGKTLSVSKSSAEGLRWALNEWNSDTIHQMALEASLSQMMGMVAIEKVLP